MKRKTCVVAWLLVALALAMPATCEEQMKLSTTLNAVSATVNPQGSIDYTIRVLNLTAFTVTGCQLELVLPEGADVTTSDPMPGTERDGSLHWSLGDIQTMQAWPSSGEEEVTISVPRALYNGQVLSATAVVSSCSGGSDADPVMTTTQVTAPVCDPPASGAWTVEADCTFDRQMAMTGHVVVNPGVLVVLTPDAVLDIDQQSYGLLIKSTGGVYIKYGGKIQ